ncbi:uncharacterized protein VP01_2437g1, partial [Puccinia sorghi]
MQSEHVDQSASGSGGHSASRDRVEVLEAEVSRMDNTLQRIVQLLEKSPLLNPPIENPVTDQAAVPRNRAHEAPPHLQTAEGSDYLPPTAPEFGHLSRLEPLKLPDVWFSGDASKLSSFLRTVRDFLRPRGSLFLSESRRIVWISRHFGFRPSENRKTPAPSENWYDSLVIDNARRKGVLDPYADLDGVEFVHPTLLTVQSFLNGLISVFGDRFLKENAKRSLNACKQRNLTIGEYNSQFSSLVYLVEDVEETRIEKYVAGLNPLIIRHAMSTAWRQVKTLDEKMAMASEAAAQLDLLAQLPSETSSATTYRPLSSNRPLPFSPQPSSPMPSDPNAMEIDAIQSVPRSLLDSSRLLCRSKNLCFRCLKPIVPGSHVGSLNCPNSPVSLEQRKNFVDRARQSRTTQISAVSSFDLPVPTVSSPAVFPPATLRRERLRDCSSGVSAYP